jgi:hypothetical protein
MFSDLSPQSGRAKGICSTNLAILPKKNTLNMGEKQVSDIEASEAIHYLTSSMLFIRHL